MMKKIILAIGLMFGGVAFVNAQQQQDTTSTQSTQQSDQYRSDTTSVDDNQHQEVIPEERNQQSSEQSDMYRTEGEGNVSDSTSNDAASSTIGSQSTTGSDSSTSSESSSTGTDSSTTGTSSTGTESSTGSTSTESSTTGTTGQPTTDDQMSNDQGSLSQDQEEGEKIEVSELPAAVQTKLQSTDYQGWVVSSARKKMWSDPNNAQSESKEVYVIEAKNGSETKKLKFDKEGNEIEHDKHNKDDQK
jgi:hypothetical protein